MLLRRMRLPLPCWLRVQPQSGHLYADVLPSLTEKLAVGGVTNMYVIAEKMLNAGNVVKP